MGDADVFLNRFSFQLSNEFRKDRSLQRYLILEILTNPARVTNKKLTNILPGQNPQPLWNSLFTYYSSQIRFHPFLKS